MMNAIIFTDHRSDKLGDLMQRGIEEAIDRDRNISPLMLEGFDFGAPVVNEKLTSNLATLKNHKGLGISVEYFDAAIAKLRIQILDVALDVVLRPTSEITRDSVIAQQAATDSASVLSVAS